jgi:hypothetical protein
MVNPMKRAANIRIAVSQWKIRLSAVNFCGGATAAAPARPGFKSRRKDDRRHRQGCRRQSRNASNVSQNQGAGVGGRSTAPSRRRTRYLPTLLRQVMRFRFQDGQIRVIFEPKISHEFSRLASFGSSS